MPITESALVRTILVDDEEPARAKLRRLLSESDAFQIVAEAGTGVDALNQILTQRPDLVFLDITMPDITGLEVARAIPAESRPFIVFVTAHDDRALEAFEVHAIDYLLKPVNPDRFHAMLPRVRSLIDSKRSAGQAVDAALHSIPRPKDFPKRFLLSDGERALLVMPSEIQRAESARNYVVVHARGQRLILRSTLDDFQSRLDPEHFARMNRSHLVNLDFVEEMVAASHGEYRVRLKDGTELVWSRRFAPGQAGEI